jgi:hypothetical protein
VFSRKTNARQKSLDRKATRDEIIAARKRMKIKTDSPDGHDNPLLITAERDKWFTLFLYLMIAVGVILIINNIVSLISYDDTSGVPDSVKVSMVVKIVLYVIEIFLYILLLLKMKRKIAIIYIIFMIFSFLMGIFNFDFMLVVRIIPIYFVFKSQWHSFE